MINYNIKDELSRIKVYIKSRGFIYNDNLIENFYLSLKSKPFLILAGILVRGKVSLQGYLPRLRGVMHKFPGSEEEDINTLNRH